MNRTVPMPAPFSTWRRSLASLVAGLTLVLFCSGLAIPHEAGDEHSGLPVGTWLDANAQHPDAPLHMETSDPEVVHACPACLLQNGRLSLLSRPASVPLPQSTGSRVVATIERSDDGPARRLAPARAPPTVS